MNVFTGVTTGREIKMIEKEKEMTLTDGRIENRYYELTKANSTWRISQQA